ncbi:hypothetical protein BB560_001918, partial [Smittium megazygosporum]
MYSSSLALKEDGSNSSGSSTIEAPVSFHIKDSFFKETMHKTREYKGKPNVVTRSLDFSLDGSHLITTTNNHTLQLFSCISGKRKQIIPSMKYGCDLAIFASSRFDVLHSSTKLDDTIRLLSIETLGYKRYFKGHLQKVTALRFPSNQNLGQEVK